MLSRVNVALYTYVSMNKNTCHRWNYANINLSFDRGSLHEDIYNLSKSWITSVTRNIPIKTTDKKSWVGAMGMHTTERADRPGYRQIGCRHLATKRRSTHLATQVCGTYAFIPAARLTSPIWPTCAHASTLWPLCGYLTMLKSSQRGQKFNM